MKITLIAFIFAFGIALLTPACSTGSASSTIESLKTPYPKRERSALLKGKEAEAILSQCSRPAPEKIDGNWLPSDAEIAEMESRLNEIRKLKVSYLPEIAKELNIEDSHMQYAGIVIQERKLIYLNAFRAGYVDTVKSLGSIDWRTDALVVCDGGPLFGVWSTTLRRRNSSTFM